MIDIRRSAARGKADHGWLKSMHTFSFADYRDPQHMGFSVLRVINEDWIAGGAGFATHSHHDMEIISYVVSGALRHEDSVGNKAVIRPGEVQRMSAGSGVSHSEHNEQSDRETHLLQIWIKPAKLGIPPGYEQKSFAETFKNGALNLVASPDGRDGSVVINQDAFMHACKSATADSYRFACRSNRNIWIQVVRGSLSVAGATLTAGDGAAITSVSELELRWHGEVEYILFDLP